MRRRIIPEYLNLLVRMLSSSVVEAGVGRTWVLGTRASFDWVGGGSFILLVLALLAALDFFSFSLPRQVPVEGQDPERKVL